MAQGTPISPHIIEWVRTYWTTEWDNGKSLSGAETARRARKEFGPSSASNRKIQQVVSDLRREVSTRDRLLDDPELRPWGQEWPSDPDEIACLYQLMDIRPRRWGYEVLKSRDPDFWDRYGIRTVREAKWALRIRAAFDDRDLMELLRHVTLAKAFAGRERAAEALGRASPYTGDLDRLLTWRPWESDENETRMRLEFGDIAGVVLPDEVAAHLGDPLTS